MFRPKNCDDSLFHHNPHQEDRIKQDLILGQVSLDGRYLTNNMAMGKEDQHKLLATAKNNEGDINTIIEKKILRKEIERQRRQHMAMLHASLRSLLPLESIKGKRAVWNNINTAVNYINYLKKNVQDLSLKRDKLNYLKKNVQDLSLKRDKLKSLLDSETVVQRNPSTDNCLTNCVTVHPCSGGVEILISSVFRKQNLLLSKVLKAMLEEGFDVICCLFKQTDERVFYTIQTEVPDPTCIDQHGLQQKLNNVIMLPRYIHES